MKIEELQQRLARLKAIVDDPQPGLMTWNQMLGEQMAELIRRWEAA